MTKTRRKSNKGGESTDSERQSGDSTRPPKPEKKRLSVSATRKRKVLRKKALERMQRPFTLVYDDGIHDDGVYNGDVYDGDVYCEGTCPHGFGTIIWSNGEQYEGQWEYGEMHGYGVYVYRLPNDAQVYQGEFKHGLLQGHGKMRWSDGRNYEGEWREGGMQRGTLRWHNGDFYEGEWNKDGSMKRGKLVTNGGLTTFKGTFVGDKPAKGTTTYHPDPAISDATIRDRAISDAATTPTSGNITTASTDTD